MGVEQNEYIPEGEAQQGPAAEHVVYRAGEQDEERPVTRQAQWERDIRRWAAQGVPDAQRKLERIRQRVIRNNRAYRARLRERDPEGYRKMEREKKQRQRAKKQENQAGTAPLSAGQKVPSLPRTALRVRRLQSVTKLL